ncbi:MAG: TlpA family protein disulfide reductase [Bacteroidales bacterium]|nr:TlpA family protein disulfide reductase [Bacteroidales bacterium]
MAPDFSMELVDAMKDYDPAYAGGQGPFVQLSDLRGKVVLLQFTASWCSVCRKEMPHLESRIWLRHNGDKDFEFIAVDRDEPIEKMLKFKEVTGITYPMAFDPQGQIFDKFALHDSGITRNVLIDRDGKIVYRTRLYDEEAFETLVSKVDSLLAR